LFLGTLGLTYALAASTAYPYHSDYDDYYYRSREEADRAEQAAEDAIAAADRAEGSAQSADYSAGYAAGVATRE
jgi:hypothetical protein